MTGRREHSSREASAQVVLGAKELLKQLRGVYLIVGRAYVNLGQSGRLPGKGLPGIARGLVLADPGVGAEGRPPAKGSQLGGGS